MEPPRRVTFTSSRTPYLKMLIEKIESVSGRMHWRKYHYILFGKEGRKEQNEQKDEGYYELKIGKSPPDMEELADFKGDMAKLAF